MTKEVINIKGIMPPPGPFNHMVRAGNFIFLSSQFSTDLTFHNIIGGDIRKQTKQAMENIIFLLESAGSSVNDIVKCVIYMKDVEKDFKAMNEVY